MTDCPSCRPEMDGARVIGIVEGPPDAPRVTYLRNAVPIEDLPPPDSGPFSLTRFLRFGGRCVETGCVHFDGTTCRLGAAVAQASSASQGALDICALRRTCRWYDERGFDACRGCRNVASERPLTQPAAANLKGKVP